MSVPWTNPQLHGMIRWFPAFWRCISKNLSIPIPRPHGDETNPLGPIVSSSRSILESAWIWWVASTWSLLLCHHHGKTVHQQIQVIRSGCTTVRSLSLNCIGAKVLHLLGHYEAKLKGSTNHTKDLLYLNWRYSPTMFNTVRPKARESPGPNLCQN